jgi:DNA-binding transcriptional MerR regulator
VIIPFRSAGGHRRYSRYQLRLAARAGEMVDHGTALEAACRIIVLEDQLEEALQHNQSMQHRQQAGAA